MFASCSKRGFFGPSNVCIKGQNQGCCKVTREERTPGWSCCGGWLQWGVCSLLSSQRADLQKCVFHYTLSGRCYELFQQSMTFSQLWPVNRQARLRLLADIGTVDCAELGTFTLAAQHACSIGLREVAHKISCRLPKCKCWCLSIPLQVWPPPLYQLRVNSDLTALKMCNPGDKLSSLA